MPSPTRINRPHRTIGGLLALVSLLAACQAQVAVGPTPKKSARPDEPVRPAASAKPGTGPAVAPGTASAAPLPGQASPAGGLAGAVADKPLDLLKMPPGAHKLLSGAVTLDGGYIVAAGAGNVISPNGGAIVAAGAGNILSHNGGQVLSHNGGAIVAAGAGNVISPNGGAIVAAGAGNLLSHNGGQLVAAGAGNVLSPNGGQLVAAGAGNLVAAGAGNLVAAGAGNLVAAGAGNYALLQALPSPAILAGDIAPVAGAEIAVRSLRTGAYLPLGVDAQGKPVYVIYTNLEGKYDLYVPAGEEGNVMVEAAVLREKKDPRLEYQNITGVTAGIDEDTTLVTEVLRRSIATRVRVMFRQDEREAAMEALLASASKRINDVPGARELLEGAFGKVWEAAHEAGLTAPGVPDETRLLYAYAATDAMLRNFDVQGTMIQPGIWWDGAEEPAIPALVQIVRNARERATIAMRQDPAFVTKLAWFKAVNERAVGSGRRRAPYEIRRPADLGTLVIEEFIVIDQEDPRFDFSPPLTNGSNFHLDALATAFESVGANGVPAAVSPGGKGEGPTRRTARDFNQVDRLNQAQFQIVLQMVAHLASMGPEAEKEILDTLRAFRTRAAAPSAAPSPASTTPAAAP